MKYLLLLLTSLFFTKGFSQVWIDSSAKWTYDYFNVSESGTWKFEYVTDTVIQGISSEVIQATKYRYYTSGFIGELNGGRYYTYSSNDSVFYFKNNQFYLLYDFGAQIGDSWVISIDTNTPCSSDTSFVQVINTGTITINNQSLRTITLQPDSNSLYALNGLCVEKFGIFPTTFQHNNFGFMPGYHSCPNGGVMDYDLLPLRCYEDVNFPNYNPNNVNCDKLMSIEQFSVTDFSIYPNPVKESINIKSEQFVISSIAILDVNGRIIYNFKAETNINISNLKAGIYFIRVITNEAFISTKTFVKL